MLESDELRLLFAALPDVLLVLRPDPPRFTMVDATEARFRETLTTREGTIGRGLFEVFPDNPDDPAANGMANLRRSLERVLATRREDTMEVQKYDIRGADGTFQVRYWSPKNVPVHDEAGAVRLILHRVEDVTELVRSAEAGDALRDLTREMEVQALQRSRELAQANHDLRAANHRLGELDRAKTVFFSNISHELRTPLTLMLGPLEDVLGSSTATLDAHSRRNVELAHQNASRLLRLVNSLLEFARAESGRLTATFSAMNLANSVAELAGMFRSAAHRADLFLFIDAPPMFEPVWVDLDLWERVVPNLVSNALKFTETGGVDVRLRETPECFVLTIQDSGVGIPEAELGLVFERFYRVSGVRGRSHEGSGIGLALVRELVRLHGGDVTVRSEVGSGSTFEVRLRKGYAHLPAESVSHEALGVEPGRDSRTAVAEVERWVPEGRNVLPTPRSERGGAERSRDRSRVLVVDDNVDLRAYVAQILEGEFDVSVAVDGEDALAQVRRSAPDIVVSDVMMPRLDGFGLLAALRADPAAKSLPVILLSARAGEESSVEGLDAGADDYLVKPFTARELLARVRTHAALARSRREWTEQLERANAELDAFSYSVSHDLRAPLRAIGGFSEALVEDNGEALDARGRDHLRRIRGAVVRMGGLIDDLLGLARVSRSNLVFTRVDLTALATSVVEELRAAHPSRGVTFTVAPGLSAHADGRLLRVLLTNLLGNAWKYTSRVEQASVELGESKGAYFVRDNGAGFDMAYVSRLFTPFQRLHTPAEFEGTGIGLATVRRVIGRHSGRVWAESRVGEGATFWFTLRSR